MATPFPFELVTPESLFYSGEVEAVIVPSLEGEMTVLAHHAPVMAVLKPGIITVDEGKGTAQRLFVRGGFADVRPDALTILAEQAIPVEELHDEVIDAQIKEAEEDLGDAETDESRRVAAERLAQLQEVRAVLTQ